MFWRVELRHSNCATFVNCILRFVDFKYENEFSYISQTLYGLQTKIVLTPMMVLTPGSPHARPSASPPSTGDKIFWCKCLQNHLQTFPQMLRTHIKSFRNFNIFRKKKEKNLRGPKKSPIFLGGYKQSQTLVFSFGQTPTPFIKLNA